MSLAAAELLPSYNVVRRPLPHKQLVLSIIDPPEKRVRRNPPALSTLQEVQLPPGEMITLPVDGVGKTLFDGLVRLFYDKWTQTVPNFQPPNNREWVPDVLVLQPNEEHLINRYLHTVYDHAMKMMLVRMVALMPEEKYTGKTQMDKVRWMQLINPDFTPLTAAQLLTLLTLEHKQAYALQAKYLHRDKSDKRRLGDGIAFASQLVITETKNLQPWQRTVLAIWAKVLIECFDNLIWEDHPQYEALYEAAYPWGINLVHAATALLGWLGENEILEAAERVSTPSGVMPLLYWKPPLKSTLVGTRPDCHFHQLAEVRLGNLRPIFSTKPDLIYKMHSGWEMVSTEYRSSLDFRPPDSDDLLTFMMFCNVNLWQRRLSQPPAMMSIKPGESHYHTLAKGPRLPNKAYGETVPQLQEWFKTELSQLKAYRLNLLGTDLELTQRQLPSDLDAMLAQLFWLTEALLVNDKTITKLKSKWK